MAWNVILSSPIHQIDSPLPGGMNLGNRTTGKSSSRRWLISAVFVMRRGRPLGPRTARAAAASASRPGAGRVRGEPGREIDSLVLSCVEADKDFCGFLVAGILDRVAIAHRDVAGIIGLADFRP